MKERIHWIDVARGLGMLFVIYGHTIDDSQYRYLLYAFHMPFFFFLSGMLFRPAPFAHFLKRSFQTLLVPYLFLAGATYGIGHFTDPTPLTWSRAWGDLFGVLYGNGANGGLGYNVILWFLPCLFITRLLYWGIERLMKHTAYISCMLFIFSLIGFFSVRIFPHLYLPFGLETACSAVVFFGVGTLSQQPNVLLWIQKNTRILLLITPFLWALGAYINFLLSGQQVDMRIGHLNNYILFYISAFSGIFMTLLVSRGINHNRILEYIGQHTLALVGWQFLAFLYLNTLFNTFLPTSLNHLLRNPLLVTLFTTAGILAVDSLWHTILSFSKRGYTDS